MSTHPDFKVSPIPSVDLVFRLQNTGLTITTFNKLLSYLAADSCHIQNLFIDWNPIYTDEFKAGDSHLGQNELHVADDDEQNPWARL